MRVLLLEDDAILGEGLRDYLRAEGHVVDWFTCLRDLQAVAGEPYDAWLVDWQLPDGSGLDWLARQRAAGDNTPSWMLTARDRLTDRVLGLDSGADDYLVKPVDPAELAAAFNDRTRAIVVNTPNNPTGKVFTRDEMEQIAAEGLVAIGMICTPAAVAQEVTDRMVACGIRSILNFAPALVSVPVITSSTLRSRRMLLRRPYSNLVRSLRGSLMSN